MAAAWELIAILGKEKLTDLQVEMGRQHVHIPVNPTADHPIARTIGLESLELLSEHYGGSAIYIGRRYAAARRNLQVERDVLLGDDVRTVAKRHGICWRYVRQIARNHLRPVYGSKRIRRRAMIQALQRQQL
ncbi:MAG: Mor transcription activator family protein [Pseudomonadota bacterium]